MKIYVAMSGGLCAALAFSALLPIKTMAGFCGWSSGENKQEHDHLDLRAGKVIHETKVLGGNSSQAILRP